MRFGPSMSGPPISYSVISTVRHYQVCQFQRPQGGVASSEQDRRLANTDTVFNASKLYSVRALGSLQLSPRQESGGEVGSLHLPMNPIPLLAFQASIFGPLDLALHSRPLNVAPGSATGVVATDDPFSPRFYSASLQLSVRTIPLRRPYSQAYTSKLLVKTD